MDEEPEPTLEEKQKYIEELQKFTQDAEEQIQKLCSQFGLDFNEISKHTERYIICPFNSGHRMPERSIEEHLKRCEWNTLGYTKDCKPLPESALPTQSPSTIKFDMELQHKVLKEAKEKNPALNIGDEEKLIPQTSDRLMSDFTIDERRAMYDYVVAHTIAPDVGQYINMDSTQKKEEKNTTILELLQQERNLKRRRAKYRGVHTNKKTHTEILREIVEQQMEMYKEYISDNYGISYPEDEKSTNSDYDKYKKEEKRYDKADCDKNYKFSRYRNYESFDDSSSKSNKSSFGSKDFHEKHKDHKSYKTSRYKDDGHTSSSKDRDSQSSQRRFDQRDPSHSGRVEKHDFNDRKWNKEDSHYKSKDKYNSSRSRRRSRSKSKERKRDDSRKRSRSNEDRLNEKSKESRSKEKKNDEKESDFPNKRKSHKKHKKEHKKKRDRSNDSYDEGRKHFKHDHKRRSRSWS